MAASLIAMETLGQTLKTLPKTLPNTTVSAKSCSTASCRSDRPDPGRVGRGEGGGEVMIRLDAHVMTRDGRAATIISRTESHVMGPYEYPILAEIENPNDPSQKVRWHYMADGRWKSNENNNHNDLIAYQPWTPKAQP